MSLGAQLLISFLFFSHQRSCLDLLSGVQLESFRLAVNALVHIRLIFVFSAVLSVSYTVGNLLSSVEFPYYNHSNTALLVQFISSHLKLIDLSFICVFAWLFSILIVLCLVM